MRTRNWRILAALLPILLVGFVTPAIAESVNVPGGSVDAIQDAVDLAGPGGTVFLGNGPHLMTETVFINTVGVTITARGGAVIVGRNDTVGGFLPLFDITAVDVTLSALTAEASPQNVGDLSLAVADGAHKLDVVKCEVTGFVQLINAADSDNVIIQQNKFDAVLPLQVGAPLNNLAVILLEGGGESRISKNKMEGPRGTGTAGIVCLPYEESYVNIQKNKVTGFDSGIYADGPGDLDIVKNKIVRCTNGMDLAETVVAVAWLLQKNKVYDNLAAGIYLQDGDNCELRKNDVRGAGTDGINIGGVFVLLQKNKSRLNANHGIYCASNSCNLIKNKALRNGNGIRVDGTGNRLQKNRGNKNIGDGIMSTGGNVDVGGNRGKKNGGVNKSIS